MTLTRVFATVLLAIVVGLVALTVVGFLVPVSLGGPIGQSY